MKVVVGALTSAEKLGYSYSLTGMTKRSLELQLKFENPIFVSVEEDPEQLEVTFNGGGNVFVSEHGMTLELPQFRSVKKFRSL